MTLIGWIQLRDLPFDGVGQLCLINDDEYLIMSHKENTIKSEGIFKYNVIKNEYIKIFDNTHEMEELAISKSIGYDKQNKIIYIHGLRNWSEGEDVIRQFDLKNNKTSWHHCH